MSDKTRLRFIGSTAIFSAAGMVAGAEEASLAPPRLQPDRLKRDEPFGKKAG